MHVINDLNEHSLSTIDQEMLASKGGIGHDHDPQMISDKGEILENFHNFSQEGIIVVEEFPLRNFCNPEGKGMPHHGSKKQ